MIANLTKIFFYPLKKYRSTCLSFTLIILIITLLAFFLGFGDDRGFNLKNYLTSTYIVGDFDSYQRSINEIINDFLKLFSGSNLQPSEAIQGPVMPILLNASKILTNNFIPFYILSIYISYWFITFAIDISRDISPWVDSQLEKKIFNFKIKNKVIIDLSYLEIFGIIFNPILLFYVIFPASDLPFAFLVLFIIWNLGKEKYNLCYLTYIICLLTRPTGLFLLPAVLIIFYFDYKQNKRFKFMAYILLILLSFSFYYYYRGYSVTNFSDTLQYGGYGGGLNVWGLPVPGWIIKQNSNINLEFNKIISIIFTPFIQIISSLGLRPSYTTIFDGNTEEILSIVSIKPYIYAYIRIIWGAIITLPGLIFLVLISIQKKDNKQLIAMITIIFSFGVGLSSSITLERYLFFAYPVLSISAISSYIKMLATIKSDIKLNKTN